MIYREADRLVARDESRRKLWSYYPDTGPLRRALYTRHLQFLAAGAEYRERLFMAVAQRPVPGHLCRSAAAVIK